MADRKPPPRLSKSARTLWDDVTSKWDLRPDELRLLEDACREASLVDRIERELGPDLLTPGSTGQVRAHPLLGEVRQHRVAMSQLLSRLNLPDADAEVRAQDARTQHARLAAVARWGEAQ